ncbi:MAG: methyltransferase domain-containing protein [Kiritimatiellae bacterium]|nr:methyltransferase domain-containing protein [Kiritimatiellia bacterium]MDD5519380.1 methyltransferase domain-containing protein [Kiritimatiellia bacterium]
MPIRRYDQKSVASRFSAAADTYNRHADVQSKAASRLIRLIDNNPAIKSILEIGCGTGILTAKLAKKFPSARICATDISKGMILESKKQLKSQQNIKWITGDFRELPGLGRFDMVTSSSSLHWIPPLDTTFQKVQTLLKKNGIFAFSMMVKGTLAELHTARKRVVPSKRVSKQLPAQKEILNSLKRCGLKIIHKYNETCRVTFKSASCLLKSLHEQGVTGGPFASGKTPLNRSDLARLVSYYNTHYKCSGGSVFATHKVLYVVAKEKNAPI